jgi:hypothetical protein
MKNFVVKCPQDWATNVKWGEIVDGLNEIAKPLKPYSGNESNIYYGMYSNQRFCTEIKPKNTHELSIDQAHAVLCGIDWSCAGIEVVGVQTNRVVQISGEHSETTFSGKIIKSGTPTDEVGYLWHKWWKPSFTAYIPDSESTEIKEPEIKIGTVLIANDGILEFDFVYPILVGDELVVKEVHNDGTWICVTKNDNDYGFNIDKSKDRYWGKYFDVKTGSTEIKEPETEIEFTIYQQLRVLGFKKERLQIENEFGYKEFVMRKKICENRYFEWRSSMPELDCVDVVFKDEKQHSTSVELVRETLKNLGK